jgi:hypothetical protein
MTLRVAPPGIALLLLLLLLVPAGGRVAAQASADALLDGSTLNDVWLHVNARDWQDLHTHYLDDTYYPVDFEWQGARIRNSGIRVRGNATRNDHKPSFRIDFNRYVGGQDLFGLKAIVLNNQWHDQSMLHDRLSMLVFRRMGIPAPRQAHVRLFVGAAREFAGVYTVSEEISKTFLQANFGEDDGYLYEFHKQTDEVYGLQDPGPNLNWFIPRFDPKTHETESVANLYLPVRSLIQAINDAPQDDLESQLGEYLDVNTFITELAIQNFMAQTDGLVGGVGMNNFYLYRFAGKRLSLLIPWDQDNSFNALEDMPPSYGMNRNVLTDKIWNEPKYRAIYLSKLLEVADSVSGAGGWLETEASREYLQIHDAAHADPMTPYSNELFEAANAFVRQFARERGTIVRADVAGLVSQPLRTRRR